ncbi:hypothetical protein BJ742DRAFT_797638 [Cladochytrium replicatum]|nr:hypothetical protein BJ742DRAFT_797638 [Cladochytrium replicatum]
MDAIRTKASPNVPSAVVMIEKPSFLYRHCMALLEELDRLQGNLVESPSPTKTTFNYPISESPEPSEATEVNESRSNSVSSTFSVLTKKRHDSGITIPDQSFVQSDSRAPDILLKIFAYLDAQSLARASQACARWHMLIKYVENSLWYNICCSAWLSAMKMDVPGVSPMHILSELESKGSSKTWKAFYRLHHNVRTGNYLFGCVQESAKIAGSYNSTRFTRRQSLLSRRSSVSSNETLSSDTKLVATWPTSLDTVFCLVHKNVVAWISNSKTIGNKDNGYVINYATFDSDLNELTSFEVLGTPEQRHKHELELILPNGEGQLVSFDSCGTIKVWDFTKNVLPQLSTTFKCEDLMSLNFFGNRIVTGSRSGQIIVHSIPQDGSTPNQIYNATLPIEYLEQLDNKFFNVAMWEDVLVIGLWDGTFLVRNVLTGAQICSFNVIKLEGTTARAETETPPSYQPMTVVLSGGTLFINNTRGDEWIAMDVVSGKQLYRLTRSEAQAKLVELTDVAADEVNVPSFDLKLADVSKDGTLLYGSVETLPQLDAAQGAQPAPEERLQHLLVWDFRDERTRTRLFRKVKCVDGHADAGSFDFWVCYDE